MIPSHTAYVRAESVSHALELLRSAAGDGSLLAGGHSIIPMMKVRMAEPGLLVDIAHIAGLDGISETATGLLFGATTRHAEIARSALVAAKLPVMAEAASVIADPLVRNRGTIGDRSPMPTPRQIGRVYC